MKVARKHTSALVRQVHEAVLIEMANENNDINVLNSRGEYNRCQLPRLGVIMGTKTIIDVDEETTLEELARTEEDIFLAANEDKKRKETAGEDAKPASKRKKTRHNKKPAKNQNAKRSASEENEENNKSNKKARIEIDEQSKKQTESPAFLEGTNASNNKKGQKLYLSSKIPSFFNFSNAKEQSQENPHPFPFKKSLKVTTEIAEPASMKSAVSNAGERAGKSKSNSAISPTPASSQMMKKPEYKAYYNSGQPPTTNHFSQKKIKCRRSKLVPPEFKVKKITEYFTVPRPPDQTKKPSEAIKD